MQHLICDGKLPLDVMTVAENALGGRDTAWPGTGTVLMFGPQVNISSAHDSTCPTDAFVYSHFLGTPLRCAGQREDHGH
jgi:hypothetical protein